VRGPVLQGLSSHGEGLGALGGDSAGDEGEEDGRSLVNVLRVDRIY
jgi:hypothetical protein